jgi:transposase
MKKFKETGSSDEKKWCGRPLKINERDIRQLKRLVKLENRLSASKITSDLNNSLSKPVTTRTVRNYLRELSYEYVVKLEKQWLSARHREQRIAWCNEHLHWTADDWKNRIFSDESTFYVLQRKNRCKIWRLEKEKLLPECLQETNTGDGGKIGIWGGISGHGRTILRLHSENMNGTLYCDVSGKELKQSIEKLPNKNGIVFQQDLVPWHTSKIIKEKMDKMGLKVLKWTPKSPDLNPIEMLWSIIDKRLASKPIFQKPLSLNGFERNGTKSTLNYV